MLYDDDRGGSPHEPIDPNDNSQWIVSGVDPGYLQQFDDVDRILIVLSVADRGAGASYPGDQVFAEAGLSWDRRTAHEVIEALVNAGLIEAWERGGDLYLSITSDGEDRVRQLS